MPNPKISKPKVFRLFDNLPKAPQNFLEFAKNMANCLMD